MTSTSQQADIAIIGGGIIGLATALTLQDRYEDARVVIAEAESEVGRHQSGHNSGVLHAGVYYRPGSEKAICCREGKAKMEAFCEEHAIAWERCGKVVVATRDDELPALDRLVERATQNGVEFHRVDAEQLSQIEPATAGVAGIHVPETGIVNYGNVCRKMAGLIEQRGGQIQTGFRVNKIERFDNSVRLLAGHGQRLNASRLINCAGLYSDRICQMAGGTPRVQIIPFRGEYYELVTSRESLCRNLIYPVPDPAFPFLGVHFTRMVDGGVECGPNAVLAMARKGYRWSNFHLGELASTLGYRGFRKLAAKHWRTGFGEIHRSLRKPAFVRALQKLIPEIQSSDLKPGRSGVRAQAVDQEGNLVDDFLFDDSQHAIHVLNAPSPGATASLAIASRIVDRFAKRFD